MTFQHVTIRVRDMEKSIRFYEEVVGLSVTRRLPGGPVFLAAEEGGCSVELIAAEEASAYAGGGISLHSRSVEFVHPVRKEPVRIVAPVPQDDNLWRYFESTQE